MKRYYKIVWLVLIMMGASPVVWSQSSATPPELRFNVNRFQVVGDNVLSQKTTDSILNAYLGQHSGLEGLQAAADALQKAIARRGHSFLRVILPPQTLTGGVVELKIVQFKLGKVLVEDNQHFSEANILRSLPHLEKNKTPNLRYLTRDLYLANAHPAKKIAMTFKESEEPESIDARLKIDDSSAGYFFSVLQNSGTEESGEYRLTGGYQYSNLFDRDHGLTFTYTTAPDDTDAVTQFGLNYRMPFYKTGSSLSFLYSDSNVDSGVVQDFFEVSGSGTVIGTRYDKVFLNRGAYRHNVSAAYNDKLFENDVEFDGTPIGSDVRSNPLTLSYAGNFTKAKYSIYFNLSYLQNFPNGSNSDDVDYDAVRVGAISEWSLLRYNLGFYYRFAGSWLFRVAMKGQQSDEPLIPGEQFGLGGMDSVRGYEEREVLADSGWTANLELWSQPLTKLKFSALLFYDMGNKEIVDPLPGESDTLELSSAGLGFRWPWKDQLNLRLDFAKVLDAVDDTEDDDSKLHLSIFYRF